MLGGRFGFSVSVRGAGEREEEFEARGWGLIENAKGCASRFLSHPD